MMVGHLISDVDDSCDANMMPEKNCIHIRFRWIRRIFDVSVETSAPTGVRIPDMSHMCRRSVLNESLSK